MPSEEKYFSKNVSRIESSKHSVQICMFTAAMQLAFRQSNYLIAASPQQLISTDASCLSSFGRGTSALWVGSESTHWGMGGYAVVDVESRMIPREGMVPAAGIEPATP
jgi:hypothetical protein